MKNKFSILGFNEFVDVYLENLITRKTISQFSNYEDAKDDIVMEFSNTSKTSEPNDFYRLIDILEKETDIIEWFDNDFKN